MELMMSEIHWVCVGQWQSYDALQGSGTVYAEMGAFRPQERDPWSETLEALAPTTMEAPTMPFIAEVSARADEALCEATRRANANKQSESLNLKKPRPTRQVGNRVCSALRGFMQPSSKTYFPNRSGVPHADGL